MSAQVLVSCTLALNNSNLPEVLAAKISHSSIFHSLFLLNFFIISQIFIVFRPFGSLFPLFCLHRVDAPYLLLSPLHSGSCPHCSKETAFAMVANALTLSTPANTCQSLSYSVPWQQCSQGSPWPLLLTCLASICLVLILPLWSPLVGGAP